MWNLIKMMQKTLFKTTEADLKISQTKFKCLLKGKWGGMN